MSLPTVTDLKLHINVTSADDDGELADMLDAAVDVVEGIIGPLTARSVTETHRNVSSDVLVLRRMPAAELVSVSSRYGSVLTALTLEDFDLDADTGLLRRADGGWMVGSFTVSYSVGRPTVPAAVRLAILVIAGHLFETQRMPGFQSADSLPAGFGGLDGVPDARLPGLGYAIPNRAQELLTPYIRTAIA